MKLSILLLIIFCWQEIPYKPKEEFEIKIDLQFQQRPHEDRTLVQLDVPDDEYKRRNSTAILPFLGINVKVLQAGEATRLKITNNKGQNALSRKLKPGAIIPVPFGFTDDVKDNVTPNEYTLTFLSNERSELSRIVLFIDQDGNFFVNGEKHGRF